MISHRHKAVFVHIPKTAGQSIETVFLRDLGLTWQERDGLLLRPNTDRARGPQRLAHLYGCEYVALGYLSQAQFDRYVSFAVVRHPYARIVSEYRYRMMTLARRGEALPEDMAADFDGFIRQDLRAEHTDLVRHLVPQVRYVMDARGQIMVDHLLRFEALQSGIAPVFRKIFGRAVALPVHNRSKSDGGITVAGLGADQRAVLQERYREDFEAFGYEM